MRPKRVSAVVIVAGLTLGGCSGSGTSDELTEQESTGEAASEEPETTEAATTTTSTIPLEWWTTTTIPILTDLEQRADSDNSAPVEMIAMPSQALLDECRIPTPRPQATSGDESFQPNTGFPFVMDNLPSKGVLEVAVVPVDWASYVGDVGMLASEFEQVERFVSFYQDVSNGDVSFKVKFVDEWLRVPGSPDDYPQDYESWFNVELTQAAVDASDPQVDYSDVDILIVVVPENSPIPAGQAHFAEGSAINHASFQGFDQLTRGMEVISDEGRIPNWMSAGAYFDDFEGVRNEWSYYVHETGHMFELADYYLRGGLDLRYSPRPEQEAVEIPIGPFSTWSVMGNQDGPSRTLNAWSRWLVGWLDDEVHCFDARDAANQAEFDVEIAALDSELEGVKAVIVRTGEHTGFVIESRRPIKWDEGLEAYRERAGRNSEGVLIYEVDTSYGTQEGALRLITPNDRYIVDMYWSNRTPGRHLDALFANGDAATIAGFEVEVRQIGDFKDVVRLDLRAG
jgi:M6 family metalloprotease-like protein